jgi:hypothetical protein
MLRPAWDDYNVVFKDSNTDLYKFENNLSTWFHIISSTWSYIIDFKNNLDDDYRLCLNSENYYVYCIDNSLTTYTPFYKYIEIQKLEDWDWNEIKNSFKINSKVYWNQKGIHSVEIPSILADYKRL